MPPVGKGRRAPTHWRSPEELAGSEELARAAEREFLELLPDGVPEATRRRFLQIVGASVALAGAGCGMDPNWPRYEKANILPESYRKPGHAPGKPRHFATAMELSGVARPVLAKSYDGRPIKLEGNPEHPASLGATDAITQAALLELYDPHRSRGVATFRNGGEQDRSWEELQSALTQALQPLASQRGRGLRVLAEASSSPTLARARASLNRRFPDARWHEWEPLGRETEREGTRLAFGRPLRPLYRLDKARVLVSLEEDFLLAHPDAVALSRAFARSRRAEGGEMSRLHVLESAYSLTGGQADHRHALPSGAIPQAAWALAARLVADEHVSLPPGAGIGALLQRARTHGEHLAFLPALARELAAHRGESLICCGPTQPERVHALTAVLNAALGNTGRTVEYVDVDGGSRASHVDSLGELTRDLKAGGVQGLVILGGNPVYDAPADLAFGEALAAAGTSVHLSVHRNETSRECDWHAPRAHFLEAWGDCLSWDGTYTLTQPLIDPLFGARTSTELVALLAGDEDASGRDLVRRTFADRVGTRARDWKRALHDGFVKGSAPAPARARIDASSWRPSEGDFTWQAASGEVAELSFRGDPLLHDGRFADNPWLQELPDPMTKLTWDNACLLSPLTARELGISQGDVLRISRPDRPGGPSLEIAAYLMPGQAQGSVTVPFGYGRRAGGPAAVPENRRTEGGGVDAYPLRTSDALWTLPEVTLERTGATYPLVSTQDHHAIFNPEQGRGQARRLPELYREASLSEYREHPDFAKHRIHHPPLRSLWKEFDYSKGNRWGMTIDLSACTGCGACMVACQAENNIPVVGKHEVGRGREMHWIRVDRYFTGELEAPQAAHQPVTCQQCENAPCEQVCPVAATVHSSEGLNDMVYNRCVGTRYCSNNCPYKVRRFNYFNLTDQTHNKDSLLKMQRNPEVTVRSRGVMEKCTYCVQRIKAVAIPARNEGRPIQDGEIVPACAQTCPTEAIVFGDLNDPQSRVRKNQDHDRAYAMLAELNVKPRTQYLAKIRNPAGDDTASSDGHHGGGHG